jgi:hypothetical protein
VSSVLANLHAGITDNVSGWAFCGNVYILVCLRAVVNLLGDLYIMA